MIINTHKIIAQNIHKEIKNSFNINFDKNLFIYGNIKPDLVPRLFTKSHRMKDSLNFVLSEIYRLINMNIHNTQDMKQFTVDLGIINHFMSDFFCYPHYCRSYDDDNLISHINYELNLHSQIKTSNQIIKKALKDSIFLKHKPILEVIKTLENSYLKSEINFDRDIYFALKASCITSLYVIENCYSFKSKKSVA